MSEKLSKTLKDIQFTMIKNKEEQKVLTHTQLDSETAGLSNDLSN